MRCVCVSFEFSALEIHHLKFKKEAISRYTYFCSVIYNSLVTNIIWKKKTIPKYIKYARILNEYVYFYCYYFLSLSTTAVQSYTEAPSFGWHIGWNFAQEIKDIHYFNNCDEKIFLGEKNSQTILWSDNYFSTFISKKSNSPYKLSIAELHLFHQ